MRLADGGPLSQQTLIDVLSVDPSVLVSILNDLEQEGLVVRRRDPADRRRHIVEISDSGREAAASVEAVLAAVERDLFRDLDSVQIRQLWELLSRVRTTPDDPACTEA